MKCCRLWLSLKLLLFLLLFFLTACGSGGGGGGGGGGGDTVPDSSSTTTPEPTTPVVVVQEGVFLDSAVQGLSYFSGNQSGVTDANGTFTYEEGQSVDFFLGDIFLGSGTGEAVMTPVELVSEATDASHPTVVNIARFLQTLDRDADTSNGIAISETVSTATEASLLDVDFDVSTTEFEENLEVQATVATLTALNEAGVQELVSSEEAQSHLEETIASVTTTTTSLVSTSTTSSTTTTLSGAIDSNTTSTTSTSTSSTTSSTSTSSTSTTTTSTSSTSTSTTSTTTTTSGNSSTIQVQDLDLTTDTFTLPSNTISFLMHGFGTSGTGFGTGFASVTNSSGTEIISSLRSDGIIIAGDGYGNVLVPIVPTQTTPSGQWSFTHFSGMNSAKITIRTGNTPSTSTITVKPYLTTSKYTASQIQTAVNMIETIYENNNVQITLESITTLTNSSFASVSSSFLNSTTSSLVSTGDSDKANLFFIEDFTGSSSGVLGIAAGIPGSLGVAGNLNGVLISIDAHVISGSISDSLLGETAAHEMGHLLGLFHPTESSGTVFDPLADTPQCTSGTIQPSDCIGAGADNLMFWQGDLTIEQTNLTSDQRHIINYSPIAK